VARLRVAAISWLLTRTRNVTRLDLLLTTASFIDLSKAGRRAIWATYAFVAINVIFSMVHVYQNIIIRGYIDGTANDADLVQSDTVVTIASIALIVVLIGAYAVNGRFLFLASRNAMAINADPKAITPGWAVGWYAVPIANLLMPFKAMKQTWNRLIPEDGTAPKWLLVWWISWVAMNLFDRVLGRLPAPDNLPVYITYNQAFVVSGFLWLIPSYFFARIIRQLAAAKHNPAEVFA